MEDAMRSPTRTMLVVCAVAVAALACSTHDAGSPPGPEPGASAPAPASTLAKSRQALIAGSCNAYSFGVPCDPDTDGPLTECQGVCSPDATDTMMCTPISDLGLATLDNRA